MNYSFDYKKLLLVYVIFSPSITYNGCCPRWYSDSDAKETSLSAIQDFDDKHPTKSNLYPIKLDSAGEEAYRSNQKADRALIDFNKAQIDKYQDEVKIFIACIERNASRRASHANSEPDNLDTLSNANQSACTELYYATLQALMKEDADIRNYEKNNPRFNYMAINDLLAKKQKTPNLPTN